MKWLAGVLLSLLIGTLALLASAPESKPQPRLIGRGVVFEDKNKNGRRDDGEPGLKGVRVSNQHEIVSTDGEGRWALPYKDDHTIFSWSSPEGG